MERGSRPPGLLFTGAGDVARPCLVRTRIEWIRGRENTTTHMITHLCTRLLVRETAHKHETHAYAVRHGFAADARLGGDRAFTSDRQLVQLRAGLLRMPW